MNSAAANATTPAYPPHHQYRCFYTLVCPVASLEDVPIKAIDILLVIVAQKLKKPVDEIPLSK